ncbi:MAG: hypothetical protein ACRDQA_10770, partial [Nocardioidaceae bacterium]
MTESFEAVRTTDAAISALAERRPVQDADPVLAGLAALSTSIDARPMPMLPARDLAAALAPPRHQSRKLAAGLTVSFLLTSSGLAAAVTGDPFAPIHYVADQVMQVGQQHMGGFLLGSDDRSATEQGQPGSDTGNLLSSSGTAQVAADVRSAVVDKRVAPPDEPGTSHPGQADDRTEGTSADQEPGTAGRDSSASSDQSTDQANQDAGHDPGQDPGQDPGPADSAGTSTDGTGDQAPPGDESGQPSDGQTSGDGVADPGEEDTAAPHGDDGGDSETPPPGDDGG